MDGELIQRDDSTAAGPEVAIRVQTKHPVLWPLAVEMGSVKAMAKAIGVSLSTAHNWTSLKSMPRFGKYYRGLPSDSSEAFERKIRDSLLVVTGKTYEELWPDELAELVIGKRAAADLTAVVRFGNRELVGRYTERMTLPDPESVATSEEAVLAVRDALRTLPPRTREILAMRCGLDGREPATREVVAKHFGISRERVKQIEDRAKERLSRVDGLHAHADAPPPEKFG